MCCRELRARLEKAEEVSGMCLKPSVHKLEAELADKEAQLKSVQVCLRSQCMPAQHGTTLTAKPAVTEYCGVRPVGLVSCCFGLN